MRRGQAGATLVVSLIMLILITLLVVAGTQMAGINLRIAGNMQYRQEATQAAQVAIEDVLSHDFTINPTDYAGNYVVDVNDGLTTRRDQGVKTSDGVTGDDYTVAIATPVCARMVTRTCPAAWGVLGAAGDQQCADAYWDVQATVTGPSGTGAGLVIHQGVRKIMLKVVASAYCGG